MCQTADANRWKAIEMTGQFSSLIFLLAFAFSGPSFAAELRELLVPEDLVGKTIEKEVDWFIEDVGAPKTDFARAIAIPLETAGIVSSISATYQNTLLPDEVYSLEIFEFARDFEVEEAVRRLKPILDKEASLSFTEINGYAAAEYTDGTGHIEIQAVKAGKRLVIIGVVNEKGDISSFSRIYFSWFSAQQN